MPFTGRFILASASPRRIELLQQLGIDCEIRPAQGEEPRPLVDEPPEQFAQRAALHKAREVQQSIDDPSAWILAADTIVVLDGEILGKPRSESEAEEMLGRLQDREHVVYTAFAILQKDGHVEYTEAVSTKVFFRKLSSEQIKRYVQTGEPMDKAGAYGIQIKGSCIVKRVEGCYFNVVGLPLHRVCEAFEELKGESIFL